MPMQTMIVSLRREPQNEDDDSSVMPGRKQVEGSLDFYELNVGALFVLILVTGRNMYHVYSSS